MFLLKKLLALSLLLFCTHSFAQFFSNEISINSGSMSPKLADYSSTENLSNIRYSFNISKHSQIGLIVDYARNMPYNFYRSPVAYDISNNTIVELAEAYVQAPKDQFRVDVLNPKLFGGTHISWKHFSFYASLSLGYVYAIGQPYGQSLGSVTTVAYLVFQDNADKAIKDYKKTIRPRDGYSIGICPSITYFITKHIGIEATLQYEYLRLRDPKVAFQPSHSDIYNFSKLIGIKYTFGKIKVKPAKTDKQ